MGTIVGFIVGYLLGTRAGTEGYEELRVLVTSPDALKGLMSNVSTMLSQAIRQFR